MPKMLTNIGLLLSVLIALPFLIDLASGFPFRRANVTIDIVMVLCSAGLAYLSWSTKREQI